jgi:ParB family chromosome partitioning protein
MARKIQFDVSETPAPPEASKAPSLSGMARSLQAAAAASIRDIDPRLIDESQFQDRIDPDDDEIVELADAIRAQGQLIPILVSPLPGGRFRIVYGRRRLAALRRMGMVAKALVREMDEDQAILAQGQENSFRRDLSWIEKAVFARQLMEAGKPDELICDALNVDQKARKSGDKLTGLSRMRQVTARFAPELIEAVGPAPKVGRDRWYELAQLLEKKGFPPGNQAELTARIGAMIHLASDDRFQQLEAHMQRPPEKAARETPERNAAEVDERVTEFGIVRSSPRGVTITVAARQARALYLWITNNPDEALQALHQAQHTSEQKEH